MKIKVFYIALFDYCHIMISGRVEVVLEDEDQSEDHTEKKCGCVNRIVRKRCSVSYLVYEGYQTREAD